EAVRNFAEALRLMPGDAEARKRLREAEKARDVDVVKRKEFDEHVAKGDLAVKNRRWGDAVTEYQAALTLYPEERPVRAALREAKYQKNMEEGRTNFSQRKYADALKNFEIALQEKPGDQEATRWLQMTKQNTDTQDDAKKKGFDQLMNKAEQAVKQKKWTEAVKAYQDALALFPNNQKAKDGLKDARYNREMEDGKDNYNKKKYREAEKNFEKALEEKPNDAEAKRWLQMAKQAK